MLWNLDNDAQAELENLAETGMGFQVVEGRLRGEDALFLIIGGNRALNLTDLDLIESIRPESLLFNSLEAAKGFKADVSLSGSPGPTILNLKESRIDLAIANLGASATPIAPTSTLVKTEKLTQPRVFYRFSAFQNDRRINSITGDFSKGTYATTDTDHVMVPSGFSAVGRYALPNNQPASWRHEIVADTGTLVYYGTVAPAFGQAGGGVEAVFPNGAINQGAKKPPVLIQDE